MRRRLNIINNYNSDPSNPETWNTLNDEDIKLLKGSAKDTYLGKAYEKFLDEEAGKEFDNN